MLNNWQRIEQIIKWAGFASVSAFARELGLNRSENLYQIKRGNNGISRDLADTIVSKFPRIGKAWLLTGEGDMLPNDRKDTPRIPFYKMDAVQLMCSGREYTPEYHIFFPVFDDCDFAAMTFSAAMTPQIPNGAVIFLRRVEPGAIVPGESYLVVSESFCGIRRLRRDPGSADVRLVPVNAGEYDDVVVRFDSIRDVFLVAGVVINRSV